MADNTTGTATGGTPAPKAKSKTKSQILEELASATGMSRKEVGTFFDELKNLIKRELGKKGPGVLAIPGLVKMQRINKPATKATTKPNPFKPGEMMTVKAKKAKSVVKVRPLKDLRDLVG